MKHIKKFAIFLPFFVFCGLATASFALAAGVPTVTTSQPANITQNSATLRGSVFPNDNITTVWVEYGTSSLLAARIDLYQVTPQNTSYEVVASLTGLQANTTYYYRVVGQNSYGTSQGSIVNFSTNYGTTSNAPVVQTFSAYSITSNSGTLSGTVNPNGYSTTYWFEYGTSPSLGNMTTSQSLGSGTSGVSLNAPLSGLSTNATYYFRLVADNTYGRTQGSITSFITSGSGLSSLPTVQTNAATGVYQTGATLNGNVHSQGSNTTVWFEYGLSSGSLTNTSNSMTIGSGSDYVPATVTISNLLQNTTYYFRAVARNNSGTSTGQTLSFLSGGGGGGTLPPVYGQPPTAQTGFITLFSGGNISLNGRVDPRGESGTAWFEYGPTVNLGKSTPREFVPTRGFLGSFSSKITIPTEVQYYFRGVAQNRYGTAYGETLIFTLPKGTGGSGGANNTNDGNDGSSGGQTGATSTETGGSDAQSGSDGECLVLTPSLADPTLLPGSEFSYTITYKNSCSGEVKRAELKLSLPAGVTFLATNHPVLAQDGGTITYSLETIPGGFQSAIVARGLVKKELKEGESALFKVDLSFIDSRGRSQVLVVYLPATVGKISGFTGNVLDAFRYLLGSWWFWLVLIVVMLAFAFYWVFVRRSGDLADGA
ncbi:MAG: fibronectin type III domain-containing protein [Patescibacteria group bacterium]